MLTHSSWKKAIESVLGKVNMPCDPIYDLFAICDYVSYLAPHISRLSQYHMLLQSGKNGLKNVPKVMTSLNLLKTFHCMFHLEINYLLLDLQ